MPYVKSIPLFQHLSRFSDIEKYFDKLTGYVKLKVPVNPVSYFFHNI